MGQHGVVEALDVEPVTQAVLGDRGDGTQTGSGGAGNDVGVYVAAENHRTHDSYDGGAGFDTLRLVLTEQEYASAAVKADIEILRVVTKADMALLRSSMTIRLGSMLVVGLSLLFAALKLT